MAIETSPFHLSETSDSMSPIELLITFGCFLEYFSYLLRARRGDNSFPIVRFPRVRSGLVTVVHCPLKH